MALIDAEPVEDAARVRAALILATVAVTAEATVATPPAIPFATGAATPETDIETADRTRRIEVGAEDDIESVGDALPALAAVMRATVEAIPDATAATPPAVALPTGAETATKPFWTAATNLRADDGLDATRLPAGAVAAPRVAVALLVVATVPATAPALPLPVLARIAVEVIPVGVDTAFRFELVRAVVEARPCADDAPTLPAAMREMIEATPV